MFDGIIRAFFTARFRKANAHYSTEKTIGQRGSISRSGKEPVEVIFYYPEKRENAPVVVQIHGGAWVGMDAVDDDGYCARLSKELGAFVVNVNYKRLYERPFPYQQEEAVDTVRWLLANAANLGIDKRKIIVTGGSAGGHITAGTAIMLAREGISIAGQVLEVPFLDFTHKLEINSPQAEKLYDLMLKIYSNKLPREHEVISPVVAPDEIMRKVAPASIIVCGRDPLHPHGEYYAQRLNNLGNSAALKRYENGYHGFGTDKDEERPEQDALREDCFWYKVEEIKRLYRLSEEENHGKA